MILYEISGLTRIHRDRVILDIPDLEIQSGGIYALFGPNGAGKTTLLDILAFLDAPTAGVLRYRSSPVRFSEPFLRPLRREVVLIHQHPILFTSTVYKNMEFGLKIRKVPRKVRGRIIEESLDLVGMRPFAHSPAHRLSGGETQRVAIARALALSPQVLLCDEPTAGVDVENQFVVAGLLKRINEEKKITILFSSHDRAQVAYLAHRTLYLNGGRLVSGASENRFTAEVVRDSAGRVRLSICDALHLVLADEGIGRIGRKARLAIDPEKIQIPEKEPVGAMGCIRGRLVQVSEENGSVRLVVDGGIRLVLLMPKGRYRQRRVLVGDDVWLSIPPDAVSVTS